MIDVVDNTIRCLNNRGQVYKNKNSLSYCFAYGIMIRTGKKVEGVDQSMEIWWMKNTWSTPSFWHKTEWPTLVKNEALKSHEAPPSKHKSFYF